jgi:hypothetical protein
MGLFETIHDVESADAFAREIKAGSIQHYGHAARIFIDYLSRDRDRVKAAVAGFMNQFVADSCPPGADGQVSRVALRFALVAAAGELATKLGILPWCEGEATSGSARCLRDWLESRGGIEPSEVREGIAQVRAFLEAHAESRFAPWGSDVMPSDASRPTINRVGFRKITADGETEFTVLPEAWKKEVCVGFDATLLAKTLIERGLLIPDKDGKFQSRHRVGSRPRSWEASMTIKNWFEEVPAIVAKSGATGATGATRNDEANENSLLVKSNLLHPTRSAGATGATRYDLAVAPPLHLAVSGYPAKNANLIQIVSSPVAPVAPVAPDNEHDLDLRVAYEERAAILEYDAGLTRVEAEQQARVEIYGDNPLPETWPPFPESWQ